MLLLTISPSLTAGQHDHRTVIQKHCVRPVPAQLGQCFLAVFREDDPAASPIEQGKQNFPIGVAILDDHDFRQGRRERFLAQGPQVVVVVFGKLFEPGTGFPQMVLHFTRLRFERRLAHLIELPGQRIPAKDLNGVAEGRITQAVLKLGQMAAKAVTVFVERPQGILVAAFATAQRRADIFIKVVQVLAGAGELLVKLARFLTDTAPVERFPHRKTPPKGIIEGRLTT